MRSIKAADAENSEGASRREAQEDDKRRRNEAALERGRLGRLSVLAEKRPEDPQRHQRPYQDVRRHPFRGLGKPEPSSTALAGWWSRRITGEHRLVYRVFGKDAEQTIKIIQCRYHY